MKCKNHAARESQNACGLCGDSYCNECLINLGGEYYCRKCLQDQMEDDGNQQAESSDQSLIVQSGKKSRFWSFILSFIPGVGYMYLGLMSRGLQTMVVFFGSIFVTSFIGFNEIMALIVPVVIFYSIFDTQQLVKRINEGNPVEDRPLWDFKTIPFNQKWLGYVLIGVGFLAMLNNVPLLIPYWFKRMLPAVIIIGLGVAILYRNTRE